MVNVVLSDMLFTCDELEGHSQPQMSEEWRARVCRSAALDCN